MNARLYRPEDYATAKSWWQSRGIPAMPENALPACGIVVENDEHAPQAMAWIYQDNSIGVAWMAWPVLAPDVKCFRILKTFDALLGGVETVCRSLGRRVIHVAVDRSSLKKWFLLRGFHKSADNLTSFVKVI
jgi:hypothetical protein